MILKMFFRRITLFSLMPLALQAMEVSQKQALKCIDTLEDMVLKACSNYIDCFVPNADGVPDLGETPYSLQSKILRQVTITQENLTCMRLWAQKLEIDFTKAQLKAAAPILFGNLLHQFKGEHEQVINYLLAEQATLIKEQNGKMLFHLIVWLLCAEGEIELRMRYERVKIAQKFIDIKKNEVGVNPVAQSMVKFLNYKISDLLLIESFKEGYPIPFPYKDIAPRIDSEVMNDWL